MSGLRSCPTARDSDRIVISHEGVHKNQAHENHSGGIAAPPRVDRSSAKALADEAVRPRGRYETAVFHGSGGFESVREHWEALAPHAHLYTQLPEWVENLDPEGICWLVVTDDDGPVAAAALLPRRMNVLGKGIRILSGVRQTLDGVHGRDLGAGALAIANPKADARAIVDSLLRGYRRSGSKWDVLLLRELRESSLWVAAPNFGILAPDGGSPFLETAKPSVQFWAEASKNLKHGLTASRKRMERERRRSVVVEARTPSEVAFAFQQFVALEGKGWKRDVGAFVNRPETAEFMRRFFVSAARAGRVKVRSLLIDDCLAACQLSVQVQDTLFLMKIAYDEELRHLSAGNILLADLISKSCEDPTINRIDCGQWASWHDRWGMEVAPRYRLVAFNHRSATALVARAALKGLEVVGK